MGQHTEDEMEEEIMKPQEWVKTATVTKIRDYTYVAKVDFETVEIADRVLRDGLLIYTICTSLRLKCRGKNL